jgi:hypothetical protein
MIHAASVSAAITSQLCAENGVQGSGHGLILYTNPETGWTDRRKSMKSSRDDRREADNRTKHLSSTTQKHYRLSQSARCEDYNMEIYTYLFSCMMQKLSLTL